MLKGLINNVRMMSARAKLAIIILPGILLTDLNMNIEDMIRILPNVPDIVEIPRITTIVCTKLFDIDPSVKVLFCSDTIVFSIFSQVHSSMQLIINFHTRPIIHCALTLVKVLKYILKSLVVL